MAYGFTIDKETNPPQATDLIIILCWTWNIISFFEHSSPSLHLSLYAMPWRTLHPRGVAGFFVDGNFIESRIPTPYQLRSASSYIYLVLLGSDTFQISNARPCIRTLARRIRAVGYCQYPPKFCTTSSGSGTLSLSSSHLRPLRANTGRIIMLTATPRLLLPAIHHCIFDMPPTNPVLPELEVDFFDESSLLGVDLF